MGWNVAVDTLVGAVPLLGDLFDIGFKSNLRNLALLDGFARQPGEVRRSSRRLLWVVILGIVVVAAGAIALSVLLLRLMSAQLRSGLFQ
jgi:hypothetical protein